MIEEMVVDKRSNNKTEWQYNATIQAWTYFATPSPDDHRKEENLCEQVTGNQCTQER